MKFLIRLYPRNWRARYGAEFEALLRQERPGIAAVINIVTTALSLRLQEGWAELREAGTSASHTFRALPRGAGFAITVALMTSVMGSIKSGFGIQGVGLLVGTVAVIALKLLHHTAGERDGHRARVALVVILNAALPLYFVACFDGQFPLKGAMTVQPSLMGLILAIGVRENAWPAPQRLRAMGVMIWASGLQSVTLITATAFGLVTPVWGVAFSSFACLFTLFFLRERRRLASESVPHDALSKAAARD